MRRTNENSQVLTKPIILTALEEGKTIRQVQREYRLGPNLVRQWRIKDPEFDAKVREILSDKDRKRRLKRLNEVKGTDGVLIGTAATWKEVFLQYYRDKVDRVRAADRAGQTVMHIMNCLDPDHDDFDELLAAEVQEIELRHALMVEDSAMRKGVLEERESMQKFLLPNLPVVGDKYARKVKTDGAQMFFFGNDGIGKALDFLKGNFNKEKDVKVIEA